MNYLQDPIILYEVVTIALTLIGFVTLAVLNIIEDRRHFKEMNRKS